MDQNKVTRVLKSMEEHEIPQMIEIGRAHV